MLRVWSKVQKLRPPGFGTHEGPTLSKSGAPIMLGALALRGRILQDFSVRLSPKDVTALLQHFSRSTNASLKVMRSLRGLPGLSHLVPGSLTSPLYP